MSCFLEDMSGVSCIMRILTFCMFKRKDANQLCSNYTEVLISAFVFATWTAQFLLYLYPKLNDSSLFCDCITKFVRDLVRTPDDQFSCSVACVVMYTGML